MIRTQLNVDWAAWTSLNTGMVSFSRDWTLRRMPKLCWGQDQLPLPEIAPDTRKNFARLSGYYGTGEGKVVFACRADKAGAEAEEKGLYVAGSFNGWNDAVGDDKWRMQLQKWEQEKWWVLRVDRTELPDEPCSFKFVDGAHNWIEVCPEAPNVRSDQHTYRNYEYDPAKTGRHLFHVTFPVSLNESAGQQLGCLEGDEPQWITLHAGIFLKSLDSDLKLGSMVTDKGTVFRIFAPRARSVDLYLYERLKDSEPSPIALKLADGMVWETELPHDRSGWFYHYRISGDPSGTFAHFDEGFNIPDPYAKAVVGPLGPSVVVPDAMFGRDRSNDFQPPSWHDMVVMEAHVRDLTTHAPIEMSDEERRGFTGLAKWVGDRGSYVKALGINAIELQPVHAYDAQDKEEYAWGYMPVNYFAPAPQYSINPAKASAIHEFQAVVEAFHRQGIAVILDVVYNHVGEPNFLQYIDKAYYFLLDAKGNYENWSGCGNTLDCDTPMVRRLIRDSLEHWIRAYGVDGFRFDLGELIGAEALAWIETELKKIKPSVFLVCEPWSFRGHIAGELREIGIASWNDGYREYIRKYLCNEADAAGLDYFMRGSHPDWSRFPAQTVNYVESHDDRCWIDKITQNPEFNGTFPAATDRRRSHMMISILMMSAGIPMINSGMDMLKSKGGVNNTYLRGDLNALDYNRMSAFPSTHDYFVSWIQFRLSRTGALVRQDGFPSETFYASWRDGNAYIQLYNADKSQGSTRLIFAINPDDCVHELELADVDFSEFRQIADVERMDIKGLKSALYPVGKNKVTLPGYSCGLWVCMS